VERENSVKDSAFPNSTFVLFSARSWIFSSKCAGCARFIGASERRKNEHVALGARTVFTDSSQVKLEQAGTLNRFLDPSIPLTWKWRWRLLKILSPLLAFSVVCMIELVALKGWMEGEAFASAGQRLLLVTVSSLAFMGILLEITIRMGQHAKRVLQFDEKRVTFTRNTKLWQIDWTHVIAFQLEPIPGQATLAKVHCVGLAHKRAKAPRKWSLVLDRAVQIPTLMKELKVRHLLLGSFAVEEFAEALPVAGPRRLPGIWPSVLAYLLIMHGLPLLAAAAPHDRSKDPTESRGKLSESAQRFIVRHFASPGDGPRVRLLGDPICQRGPKGD
jgi:hypothetical protein